MRHSLLLCITAITLFTSCLNPRVVVDLDKSLTARSVDSVMVFEKGDILPTARDTIGRIRVLDSGLTLPSKGTYPKVLDIAKQRTAHYGGNAFYVDEHLRPDYLSSCHRIRGTMLLLPSPQVSSETAMALQQAGINRDVEMANRMVSALYRNPCFGNHVRNVLKASFGPAVFINRIRTPLKDYCGKVGFDYSVEYQRVSLYGLGVGITVAGNITHLEAGKNLKLFYLGPEILWAIRGGTSYGAELAFSLGYTHYADGYHSGNGMGFKARFGFEYTLMPHLAIGAELNLESSSFKQPHDIQIPEGKGFNYGAINLLIGPRYYF